MSKDFLNVHAFVFSRLSHSYSFSDDEPISTKGRPVKRSAFHAPKKSHSQPHTKIFPPSKPLTVYPMHEIHYDVDILPALRGDTTLDGLIHRSTQPKVPSFVGGYSFASPVAASSALPLSATSQSPNTKQKQFLAPTRTFSHVEVPRPPGHVERCRNTRWLHILEPPRETNRSSDEGGSDDELVLSTATYKPSSFTHGSISVQRKRRRQDDSDSDSYEPNNNWDYKEVKKSPAKYKRTKLDQEPVCIPYRKVTISD